MVEFRPLHTKNTTMHEYLRFCYRDYEQDNADMLYSLAVHWHFVELLHQILDEEEVSDLRIDQIPDSKAVL